MNETNKLEFNAQTCMRDQVREKAHQPITIGVGHASDLLNKSMSAVIG